MYVLSRVKVKLCRGGEVTQRSNTREERKIRIGPILFLMKLWNPCLLDEVCRKKEDVYGQ
jgi:hypothetical protein